MTKEQAKQNQGQWFMHKDLWDSLRPGDLIAVKGLPKNPELHHITVLHKEGDRLILSYLSADGPLASAAGVFEFADGYGFVVDEEGNPFEAFSQEIIFISNKGAEASEKYLVRKKSALVIDDEECDLLAEATRGHWVAIQEIMADQTSPTNFEKMSTIMGIVFGEGQFTKEQVMAICWLTTYYGEVIEKFLRQATPIGIYPADILAIAMMDNRMK